MKRSLRALSIVSTIVVAAACESAPVEDEQSSASEINSAFGATIFGTAGGGLRVRNEPSTSSAQVGTVWDDQRVTILCQTKGTWADGTDIWNKIQSPAGYVNDAYVWTGVNGFHPDIARCSGSSSSGSTGTTDPGPSPSKSTSSRGFTSIWGGKSYSISSEYGVGNGQPLYDYGRAYGLDGTVHTGVDVAIPAGTPLYAPMAGTVTCGSSNNGNGTEGVGCCCFSDTGNGGPYAARIGVGRIEIELDDGSALILGHSRTSLVRPGQRVAAGEQVGTSGGMNGPHVHVEMRVRSSGTTSGWRMVDPRTRL